MTMSSNTITFAGGEAQRLLAALNRVLVAAPETSLDSVLFDLRRALMTARDCPFDEAGEGRRSQ